MMAVSNEDYLLGLQPSAVVWYHSHTLIHRTQRKKRRKRGNDMGCILRATGTWTGFFRFAVPRSRFVRYVSHDSCMASECSRICETCVMCE
jgi:hypothetical protein